MKKIVGKIAVPNTNDVVLINQTSKAEKMSNTVIETNTRISIIKYGAFENYMFYFIDAKMPSLHAIVANRIVNISERSANVTRFMQTSNIPTVTNGVYPIMMRYTLPGKSIVTSEIIINTKLTE